MADFMVLPSTRDGCHGPERSRTQSEGSNVKHCPVERQRTLSDQQSDRITSIRNRSSGLSHIADGASSIDSGSLSSIQESDALCDRKASTGSNSEFIFDTQDESKYRGMVKDHYISTSTTSNCRQCNKKFSVKLRPHHCRRCGDIYCMGCLRYRRKLNKLATFDPNGKPRKVCKACFTEEGGTIGRTRNLKDEFFKERQLCKLERVLRQRTFSLTDTFWRDQLDMEKECSRLLRGFSEAVGTSEAKKTLHELHQLVKPPSWQKSSFWKVEKSAAHCRACKGSLGIRKKKRNCKVCGLALCKKCSNKELLLYIEGGQAEGRRTQSKLGIIKFVGCPEKEPDISLLLHVCKDCKEYISHQQTTAPPPSNSLATLFSMNDQFTELQNRTSPLISECEQIIESLELSEKQNNTSGGRLSNLLDQINEDLDTYERLFHKLRHLGKTAETGTQNTLFKHYAMAKYDFYMDNRHTYRSLRKTTEQDNSISSVTKPNVTTNISKITEITETDEQRLKEVEKDSLTDKGMEAAAGPSTNSTKVQTEIEERKTEHVKRNSSFFDRNLRPGSFLKRQANKKQFKPDSEPKVIEDYSAETDGTQYSKKPIGQAIVSTADTVGEQRPDQVSFKSFVCKESIVQYNKAPEETFEKAVSVQTAGGSSLGKSDKNVLPADKTTIHAEVKADNNEENSSAFDRKARKGSFFKRKTKKNELKADSASKLVKSEAETVNIEACGYQSTVSEQTTKDQSSAQSFSKPLEVNGSILENAELSDTKIRRSVNCVELGVREGTVADKKKIVQYNKAPEETFEKAVSVQSAGGSSLGKSDKNVLPADKTTIHAEVKADNNEENSSAFDRKARKGSFFKRKTKKNELKADSASKLVKSEEETVNIEACGYQSTVSEQTTKDQTSGQSFSNPLEVNGSILENAGLSDTKYRRSVNCVELDVREGTVADKEEIVQNNKAPEETFEKAVFVQSAGGSSLSKSDKNVLPADKTTIHAEVKADNNEENSSAFDRKARKGSFFKRKTKKNELKADPASKLVKSEKETVIIEACGYQSTVSEQTTKDQSPGKSFSKPLEVNGSILENAELSDTKYRRSVNCVELDVREGTVADKEEIVQNNKAPEETFEKAVFVQSAGGSSLSKSDKNVLPEDKTTIDAEVKADNNEENSSAFDRKARKGSFFKRKTKKNELKADSASKLVKSEEETVNIEACGYQSTVSEQTTKDQTSGQSFSNPLEVNGSILENAGLSDTKYRRSVNCVELDVREGTVADKEEIVQNNKAPEETFEKAVFVQSAGGSSLSKSDKNVLPADKTTIDAEVKADNNEENSSAFDRKARKGSFFKRKPKKNELKADPASKLVKSEEKTINIEACGYQSTVSEQTTKDQTSGQSFSEPLEADGCTSKNLGDPALEEISNVHLETVQANIKKDISHSVKRSNSFFDRQLRPGSFLKRKTKQKTVKSDSETMKMCEEVTEGTETTKTVENLESSDKAEVSADGKTSRKSGEVCLKKETVSWKR